MEIRKQDAKNKLQGTTKWLMEKSKPVEELYDVENDPFEMNNLASDPQFSKVLKRMRKQLNRKMIEIGDLSFVPEAEMKRRAGSKPPYTMHREHQVYKLRKILNLANKVGKAESGEFMEHLDDKDSAIRFWAVTGISADDVVDDRTIIKVKVLLDDSNPRVRIAACEALFIHQGFDYKAMEVVLEALRSGVFENVLHAASTLERVDIAKGREFLPELRDVYEN